MIADWAAKPTDVPYANFGNPQSLNLYSHVENNPTTVGDADGHCPWCLVVAGAVALTEAINYGANMYVDAVEFKTAAAVNQADHELLRLVSANPNGLPASKINIQALQ